MAGGITKAGPAGYFEIEYTGPWGGLQLDQPSTHIDPGACVTVNGMEIRQRLTPQPALGIHTSSGSSLVLPVLDPGEFIGLITSMPDTAGERGIEGGLLRTVIVTNKRIFIDYNQVGTPGSNPITFIQAGNPPFSFPNPYSFPVRFGSVVIGGTLYISSSQQLGIYAVTPDPLSVLITNVTEISSHNGSGAFIGADFLGTISQRLVLGCIIGGDGNTTGTITGINVPVGGGGSGYPASGTFTVIGGGGTGASGTYTTSGGSFSIGSPSTSFTFTNNGSGYIPGAGAQVELVAATGSGAVLNAVVSSAISPSTNNHYPDYFAWSFPNSFGQFDPNNSLTPGGFNQITEARGFISGFLVFQSVIFVGHNGGVTEVTPNTTSNVVPFTFNPLWSADQGMIVRYGSMAQFGDIGCFLSQDNSYIISPGGGLQPIGSRIANLIQFQYPSTDGFTQYGVMGSIVQIDGEIHYLLAISDSESETTTVYDFNLKSKSWYEWSYAYELSCAIYQSYDVHAGEDSALKQITVSNDWIFAATIEPSVNVFNIIPANQQISGNNVISVPGAFSIQFRTEDISPARMHSIRRIVMEYENVPQFQGTNQAISATLTGQNSPSQSTANNLTLTSNLTPTLLYPSNTQPSVTNQVLVVQAEPTGPAFTGCNTTLSLSYSGGPAFITRIRQICELDKSEVQ